MRNVAITVLVSVLLSAGFIAGCHADPDDPAGQAGELTDAVRRENAIANIQRLYAAALAKADGNRSATEPKSIADATVEKLSQAYLDYPEDSQNGAAILNLLSEMRDSRSLPALLKALDWRAEVSEEHAITAARTLKVMDDIPDDKKGDVIAAISDALDKVNGARGVDNRMRIEFLRALGALNDQRAAPILTKIATRQAEEQNFLINRLAAEQLGRLESEESIDAFIEGLFLFAPNNPAMRMNDVAAEGLVRIGRPALQPLLTVLRGEHDAAKAIVEEYIEAVRQRDANAAEAMSVEMLMGAEATFTLGALGYPEALAPMLAETQAEDVGRKINASIQLVRLSGLNDAQRGQVREALKTVYGGLGDAEVGAKPQLIAAMRHLYSDEMMPFFMEQARQQDLFGPARMEAVRAYALLANKEEAEGLKAFIQQEPSAAAERNPGNQEDFMTMSPALDAAEACDADIACWVGKLDDSDALVARKAAYMLGRFGAGNEQAIQALTGKLGHSDVQIRLAALTSLDHIATAGAPAAVERIDELRAEEEGRSIWNNFAREALPVQARLRNRAE